MMYEDKVQHVDCGLHIRYLMIYVGDAVHI